MMAAYPHAWSAECGRMEEERAHMLLPLAWLVRVEDTPEHRQWLETMAAFVFDTLSPAGAIPQLVSAPYTDNAQYGTSEAPIVYETGDPGTDLLYTMNFAFSGMLEAAAATGDPRYAEAVDRMAGFLIRAQTHSEVRPELDGTWYRAFDFERWDYFGSDGDPGWGVWTTETGWTHSWITGTLALRQMSTCLWDASRNRDLKTRFEALRPTMLPEAALRPDEGLVAFRPFSYWDRDRILISARADQPPEMPVKVRLFVSGIVMEAFVGDRIVLSTRLYRHRDGQVALTAADGPVASRNLLVRRFYGDNR